MVYFWGQCSPVILLIEIKGSRLLPEPQRGGVSHYTTSLLSELRNCLIIIKKLIVGSNFHSSVHVYNVESLQQPYISCSVIRSSSTGSAGPGLLRRPRSHRRRDLLQKAP